MIDGLRAIAAELCITAPELSALRADTAGQDREIGAGNVAIYTSLGEEATGNLGDYCALV